MKPTAQSEVVSACLLRQTGDKPENVSCLRSPVGAETETTGDLKAHGESCQPRQTTEEQ